MGDEENFKHEQLLLFHFHAVFFIRFFWPFSRAGWVMITCFDAVRWCQKSFYSSYSLSTALMPRLSRWRTLSQQPEDWISIVKWMTFLQNRFCHFIYTVLNPANTDDDGKFRILSSFWWWWRCRRCYCLRWRIREMITWSSSRPGGMGEKENWKINHNYRFQGNVTQIVIFAGFRRFNAV